MIFNTRIYMLLRN